jgi:Lon protease-like protein
MSPHGAEEKQALLEAPDLPARAKILITLAEMDVAGGGGESSTLQ